MVNYFTALITGTQFLNIDMAMPVLSTYPVFLKIWSKVKSNVL